MSNCIRNTYTDPSALFLDLNNLDKDHLGVPFSGVVSECAWPNQNENKNVMKRNRCHHSFLLAYALWFFHHWECTPTFSLVMCGGQQEGFCFLNDLLILSNNNKNSKSKKLQKYFKFSQSIIQTWPSETSARYSRYIPVYIKIEE